MSTTDGTRDLCGTLEHDETIYPHPGCRHCRHSIDRDRAGRFRVWLTWQCSPRRQAGAGWQCLRCSFSGTQRTSFALAMADALDHVCADADDYTDLLGLAALVDSGSVVLR
jgi:hypothetical protein